MFAVFLCFSVPGIHLQLDFLRQAKYIALILFKGTQDHMNLFNLQLISMYVLSCYLCMHEHTQIRMFVSLDLCRDT